MSNNDRDELDALLAETIEARQTASETYAIWQATQVREHLLWSEWEKIFVTRPLELLADSPEIIAWATDWAARLVAFVRIACDQGYEATLRRLTPFSEDERIALTMLRGAVDEAAVEKLAAIILARMALPVDTWRAVFNHDAIIGRLLRGREGEFAKGAAVDAATAAAATVTPRNAKNT